MAHTIGRVVETKPDGWAVVVAEKEPGCGNCTAASQCQGGPSGTRHQTPALNRIGAKVGDRVMLTVDSGMLLSRMALLYLLPVAFMMAGAFWGAALDSGAGTASDGQGIGHGLAGFALGFGISVAISRVWSRLRPLTPIISRIITRHFQSPAGGSMAGCGCGRG